jgi:branched-chain amino acid transport system permease protein
VKSFLASHGRLLGFIILGVFFALIPLWVQSPYYIDLLIVVMINAGLAMTFVMLLRTGLISLCIAAFWGIGAYASAMLSLHAHLSFWACLPLSTLITAAFALVIGYVIIRNAGFTFIIMTTVIGMLFVTLVGNIKSLGAYNGVSNIPAPNPLDFGALGTVAFDSKVDFFYLALILLVIIVLVINAFYSSWAGRAWNAIGLNPRLAQSMGVNVFRYRLLSFVVGCAIAGLIGSFYAHYQTFIIPTAFNLFPKTIYIQVYAVLGGVGFATLGPIVGAGLLTFFPEWVSVAEEKSILIVGAMVVIVVVFLPKGLLSLPGYFARLWAWLRATDPREYPAKLREWARETRPSTYPAHFWRWARKTHPTPAMLKPPPPEPPERGGGS